MKGEDDFLGADHWTWFVQRGWLASGGAPQDARGGKVQRPHSLPGRSCDAEEGGGFELLGRLELGTLGLETPHSLLGISGGADRGGFG